MGSASNVYIVEEEQGIIPRVIRAVFNKISEIEAENEKVRYEQGHILRGCGCGCVHVCVRARAREREREIGAANAKARYKQGQGQGQGPGHGPDQGQGHDQLWMCACVYGCVRVRA